MTGEVPLVSVLIPTWNRAHTIERAVDSALGSSYPRLEVIVSDNASEDATRSVLAPYADDPRFRLLLQERNLGPVPNWEAALAAARGDYAKILWSDDSIETETIARLIEPLLADPEAGFAVGPALIRTERDPSRALGYHYRISPRRCRLDLLDLVLGLSMRVPHLPWSPGAGLMRTRLAKEGLEAARRIPDDCWRRAVGPDVFLLYWSLLEGFHGVYVPAARSTFYEGETSITQVERSRGQLDTCYAQAVASLLEGRPDMSQLFWSLWRFRMRLSRRAAAGSARVGDGPGPAALAATAARLGRWALRRGAAAWTR